MNKKNIFQTKDLKIGYKKKKNENIIKENINFCAIEGELIAMIGSNGIGKSTFLRTLIGLIDKLGGKILFEDKEKSLFSQKELAKKISFVSTETIDIPNMLVYELVALGRFPYTNWQGKIKSEDDFFIQKAINLLDINHLQYKYVNELSDGEKQRAMIARTLAQNTPIIVLDEPTAYLDLAHKFLLINTLQELTQKEKKTIIFTTHDLNIALKTADKIWLFLNDSHHQGAPEDLILNNSIAQIFTQKEILFDEENFNFLIQPQAKKNIALLGEKNRIYTFTQKALQRKGFIINNLSNEKIQIIQNHEKTKWEYKSKNYDTLYELLESI